MVGTKAPLQCPARKGAARNLPAIRGQRTEAASAEKHCCSKTRTPKAPEQLKGEATPKLRKRKSPSVLAEATSSPPHLPGVGHCCCGSTPRSTAMTVPSVAVSTPQLAEVRPLVDFQLPELLHSAETSARSPPCGLVPDSRSPPRKSRRNGSVVRFAETAIVHLVPLRRRRRRWPLPRQDSFDDDSDTLSEPEADPLQQLEALVAAEDSQVAEALDLMRVRVRSMLLRRAAEQGRYAHGYRTEEEIGREILRDALADYPRVTSRPVTPFC
eukprot:GGOE01024170.1.p1 GENE.GGOE01024170.1~~GGOE01024170.1.p1  ORF type:complete len:270 (-),score=32.68 GGOE01024170.1:973-1782(-)